MATFSGHYEASITDSVGIRSQISDFEDQKWQYDVSEYPVDPQYMEFVQGSELIMSSDFCASITTQPTNSWPVLSTDAPDNRLLSWYESSMESLGLQEIMDPVMINEKQISRALYSSSVNEKAVYPETISTVNEKTQDWYANDLQEHTSGHGENCEVRIDKMQYMDKPISFKGKGKEHTSPPKMKKRKTDQYDNGSVMETYVKVSVQTGSLKKCKKDRCESSQSSSASKNHEEKWKPKFDPIRCDTPELLPTIGKEEPKGESQKDYIHLRARKGQATDSHSLAERVRREKISERMKVLQDLVPGCNKVTGKALVLEKIINYVQSLQNQVETLSMTLASVLARCHFDVRMNGHGHLSKEWSNVSQIEDIHGSFMCYKQQKQ